MRYDNKTYEISTARGSIETLEARFRRYPNGNMFIETRTLSEEPESETYFFIKGELSMWGASNHWDFVLPTDDHILMDERDMPQAWEHLMAIGYVKVAEVGRPVRFPLGVVVHEYEIWGPSKELMREWASAG